MSWAEVMWIRSLQEVVLLVEDGPQRKVLQACSIYGDFWVKRSFTSNWEKTSSIWASCSVEYFWGFLLKEKVLDIWERLSIKGFEL